MPDTEPQNDTNPAEESTPQGAPATEPVGGETPSYNDLDAWLTAQDEPTQKLVRGLYDKKTMGLKSALDKERDKATDFARQLRETAKTADDTTAAKLNQLAAEKDAELEDARKESTFYRDAAAAGVPGERLERAWRICKNGGYFDRRGEPDLEALKTELPELFAVLSQPSRQTAGRGVKQAPAPADEDPIRAAVNRARGH
jgi:hypothetical protein